MQGWRRAFSQAAGFVGTFLPGQLPFIPVISVTEVYGKEWCYGATVQTPHASHA